MSMPTSSGGRRQFSLLNANRVRWRTLRAAHSSTTLRTTLTLARCPATRGMPRDRAQRPLPSMMIATCCGESAIRVLRRCGSGFKSDLHELLFLVGHGVIDVGDMLIGQFLNVVLSTPLIVLRNEFFLEHLLQLGVDFAAHAAHGHARILRFGLHHLDDVAPPFLRQRGHVNTNYLPRG